jgi:hypothetical protein
MKIEKAIVRSNGHIPYLFISLPQPYLQSPFLLLLIN